MKTTIDPTRELLPHIVDHKATVNPDDTYAEFPISELTYDEGYRRVTYQNLANVINGLAWWLQENFGTPPDKSVAEVIPYLGPNDLRYYALILAAVKVGYCILLESPRNSLSAHQAIFEQLTCKRILSSSPPLPFVQAVVDAVNLPLFEIPSIDELLSVTHQHFPYNKTYDEAVNDRLAVVHTSGSTGVPKPIVWTHETASNHIRMSLLEAPSGYQTQDDIIRGKRLYVTFPPFHAACAAYHLFNAIPLGTILIIPISGAIPSAAGLVSSLKQTTADMAMIVPSIVLELGQNTELLEFCASHLDLLFYCGGDLPQAIGDTIVSKIRLLNQYGATELGLVNQLRSSDEDPHDWKYIHLNPNLSFEFRPFTDVDYDLFVTRTPEKEKYHITFTEFPDIQEYRTRDLWVKHPTKENLWKWQARADDIIVFLNGEKTNPISMEQHIVAANSQVSCALVVGAQRFQASLLIEPVPIDGLVLDPQKRAHLIESVWPSIEQANQECPSHARIAKTHILFTTPEKPMIRTPKGTIQRAATVRLYETEINDLYASIENVNMPINTDDGDIHPELVFNRDLLKKFLRDTIVSATSWTDGFSENDNFISIGMDSLQSITIVRRLRHSLNRPSLSLNDLYMNPTVTELVAFLQKDSSALSKYSRPIDLPLPNLNETLDAYLAAATPHLTAEELQRTTDAVQDFRSKSGPEVLNRIISIHTKTEGHNWQHNLHVNGIYLRCRDPIHPYGTFYGVHPTTITPHGQAERAAIIARAAYQFKVNLENGQVEQPHINDEPLCVNSFHYLFNTSRQPQLGLDQVHKTMGHDYFIVLINGHIFKVSLVDDAKIPLSYSQLRASFEEILDRSSASRESVAALTADDRDSWAQQREKFRSIDPRNTTLIDTIEDSAFVVCLDDAVASTATERANQLILGPPSNRWSDKSLQFVVLQNGVSGFTCEHSMLDALSAVPLNSFIVKALKGHSEEYTRESNLSKVPNEESNSVVQELDFVTDSSILEHITHIESSFRQTHTPVELDTVELDGIGKDFFRQYGVPPKAGYQVIIQLACLRQFGRQHPAWETVTLMPFYKGRLDWIQTASAEIIEFCQAVQSAGDGDDNATTELNKKHKTLLLKATRAHTKSLLRTARGKGFLAYLEAFHELLQEPSGQELPTLFTDPTWDKMRVTSTRKIKTDAVEGLDVQEGGFLMPDPESALFHYEIGDDRGSVLVQATTGRTTGFRDALVWASTRIRRILEGC